MHLRACCSGVPRACSVRICACVCAGMHVRAFVRPWARAVACMLQCVARACTCANSSKRRPSADLVAECEAAAHAAHDVDDRAYLCARPPVLVVCVCVFVCARACGCLSTFALLGLSWWRSATCCKRVATDHAALCCKTSCCAQQLIVLRSRPKRQTTVARESAANNHAKARRESRAFACALGRAATAQQP